jgi:geranylgeranyl reductase
MAEMYVSDVSPTFTDGSSQSTTSVSELELLSTALPSRKNSTRAIRDVPVTRFLEEEIIRVEAHPIPEHTPRRVQGRIALIGDAAGYVTKSPEKVSTSP